MGSYVVQPGDSWAKIAGSAYGDQRRYLDLANANGGLGMLHPGDTINLPDFSGASAPVISNDQWANTPTGVKNGQVQYANQGQGQGQNQGGGQQPGTVALPPIGGVKLPTFGGGPGASYDSLTGGRGVTNPYNQTGPAAGAAGGARANSAGRYDKRTGRNVGVNSAGGATPTNQRAGPNANPLLWGQLPPATGSLPAGTPGQYDQRGGRNTGVPNRQPSYITPPGGGTFDPGAGIRNAAQGVWDWLNSPVPGTPPGHPGLGPGVSSGFNGIMIYPGQPGPTPGQSTTAGNAQQAAEAARYGGQAAQYAAGFHGPSTATTPAAAAFPPGKSEIDPSMANVADAARYSAMAIYAYGGGYQDKGLAGGNRNTLPTIIHALVVSSLPRPPGMSDADYMLALGYAPDENGNYVRQDPQSVTSGYGGGAYDTQMAQPASYGYGGYGGYGGGGGYSNYPSYGRSAPTTQPYGLVNWRITG